jgi:hypothetical protein
MPYGTGHLTLGAREWLAGWLADAVAVGTATAGPLMEPMNGVLLCPSPLLPTGSNSDDGATYTCTQVWQSGGLAAYRVDRLWLYAVGGGVVLPLGCATIATDQMVTVAYGAGYVPGVPAPTNSPTEVTLPCAVYVVPSLADPCYLLTTVLPYNLPVVYLLAYQAWTPPGIDFAATPEVVVALTDTGGSVDDSRGVAQLLSAETLPDWWAWGELPLQGSGPYAPLGRRSYP